MALQDLMNAAGKADKTYKNLTINLNKVIDHDGRISIDRFMSFIPELADYVNEAFDEWNIQQGWIKPLAVYQDFPKAVRAHIDKLYNVYDTIDIMYQRVESDDMDRTIRVIIKCDHKATGFSDLSFITDFEEDARGTLPDEIELCDSQYAMIRQKRTAQKYDARTYNFECILLKHNGRPYTGMKYIPESAKLSGNVVLKDCTCATSIDASSLNDNTLVVDGTVCICAVTPIECNDKITIVGKSGSTLYLKCIQDMQPCIGPTTNAGMSYGRWSPAGKCPEEIIIDGVQVICQPKETAFSIGQYGDSGNKIPKVTLLNGGTLSCPEMTGERVIVHDAKPPQGSTKISEPMQYVIRSSGQSDWELYSEEKKTLIKNIESITGNNLDCVTIKTSEKALELAQEVLNLRPTLDVTLLVNGEHESDLSLPRCAALIQLNAQTIPNNEWVFEDTVKYNFLTKTFFSGAKGNDFVGDYYTVIYWLDNNVERTPYLEEVMYELIPSYFYSFRRDLTHYENVKQFMNEMKDVCTLDRLDIVEANRSKILEMYSKKED